MESERSHKGDLQRNLGLGSVDIMRMRICGYYTLQTLPELFPPEKTLHGELALPAQVLGMK